MYSRIEKYIKTKQFSRLNVPTLCQIGQKTKTIDAIENHNRKEQGSITKPFVQFKNPLNFTLKQ